MLSGGFKIEYVSMFLMGFRSKKGQCNSMLSDIEIKIEYLAMRFEELKLKDNDCDGMLPNVLKIECQSMHVVELNVLSFNSHIPPWIFS